MKAIDETIVNRIRDRLVAADQTLAVAESVTAGMLQVAFSSAFNATAFFQGGITAYNLGQKARHLLLDPIHGERCNCVSAYTATTMAENCCTLFSSDWGIGITGYASPMPEAGVTQLYAFYSIAKNKKEITAGKIPAASEEPLAVRYFFCNEILTHFQATLQSGSIVSL
ncbi:CinA family protein [Chitinophaga sp. sic0106]|uniref:CinA family protein n=1 Tax=Chitinophaga sp. sic0106 TaxID=2854785 RepID=UPI001C446743|nr:CinA family protein [Chitinophaga sp. sic0106]MBV7533775.1 CinA family protein [Chitinophaga sp. sic0106]